MAPDSIDADPQSLPRSFRGYNRRATEELFRRVAWDYAVLAGEHRKLKTAAEPAAGGRRAARSRPGRSGRSSTRRLIGSSAAAQKAARDLRESTRAECELALKKANRRAGEIEEEAFRASGDARAVLEAAAALRLTLEDALRTLERDVSASATNGAVVALPNSALANTARPEPL